MQLFPAQPGHGFKSFNVLSFVEPVIPGLGSEKFIIKGFVLEEELPHEEIAHMFVAYDDRCCNIPHMVLAFIKSEISVWNA